MTSATPKPRAGEHTIERWNGWELERDEKGPFVQVRDYEALRIERDLLREREKALVEVLGKLLDVTKRANIEVPMSDAPVFFAARELLAKHER